MSVLQSKSRGAGEPEVAGAVWEGTAGLGSQDHPATTARSAQGIRNLPGDNKGQAGTWDQGGAGLATRHSHNVNVSLHMYTKLLRCRYAQI